MTIFGRSRRITRASCSRVCGVVDDAGVGKPERFAHGDAEHLRRALRFRGAQLGRSARAHLALREIENARAMPGARRLGERAAAGELDVVAMRGDGEKIDRLG